MYWRPWLLSKEVTLYLLKGSISFHKNYLVGFKRLLRERKTLWTNNLKEKRKAKVFVYNGSWEYAWSHAFDLNGKTKLHAHETGTLPKKTTTTTKSTHISAERGLSNTRCKVERKYGAQ